MEKSVIEMLQADNAAMREAGCELAQAALHVATEYDGVHRLMLAVSGWTAALANEGGRDAVHGRMAHPVGMPAGYLKLPDGARCKCPKMWQDGPDFYCCNPASH